jgi:hypothetical protein
VGTHSHVRAGAEDDAAPVAHSKASRLLCRRTHSVSALLAAASALPLASTSSLVLRAMSKRSADRELSKDDPDSEQERDAADDMEEQGGTWQPASNEIMQGRVVVQASTAGKSTKAAAASSNLGPRSNPAPASTIPAASLPSGAVIRGGRTSPASAPYAEPISKWSDLLEQLGVPQSERRPFAETDWMYAEFSRVTRKQCSRSHRMPMLVRS